jgi:hypothetical protein
MFIDFGGIITCYGMGTTKIALIKDFVGFTCSHQKNKDHLKSPHYTQVNGITIFWAVIYGPHNMGFFPLPKLERDPLSEVCFKFSKCP